MDSNALSEEDVIKEEDEFHVKSFRPNEATPVAQKSALQRPARYEIELRIP